MKQQHKKNLIRRHIWLARIALFALLVGLAILGTAGPAPGSLEGAIFTTLPTERHLIALPEVIAQLAAFSFLLVAWCKRPARWKNIVAIVGVIAVVSMSVLGVLDFVQRNRNTISSARCCAAERSVTDG